MESIADVLKKNPTFQKMWGSKQCVLHLQQHVVFHNAETGEREEFCPVCEKHKADEELVRQETKKSFNSFARTLDNKSIFEDIEIQAATFERYREDPKEPELAIKKREALHHLERLQNGETFNLWFNGLPGVGKSHLAFSILRELNGQDGKSCLFISVAEMFRIMKNSFNDKGSKYTEYYFVDLMSNVDYLVLDDLGAETGATDSEKQATDFIQSVLKSVAGARQSKATIITTNLSSAQVKEMYDPKLVSRLLRKVSAIKFTEASDKRIKDLGF